MKRLLIAALLSLSIISCSEEPELHIENIEGKWVLDHSSTSLYIDLNSDASFEMGVEVPNPRVLRGMYSYGDYLLTLRSTNIEAIYGVTFVSDDEIILDEVSKTELPNKLNLIRE